MIPDTLAVGSYGPDYRITALVESSGRRFAVWVLADDCANRHGDIWGPKKRARNAFLNGDAPKDKLFTHLCATGLPLIDEMKSLGHAQAMIWWRRRQSISDRYRMILAKPLPKSLFVPLNAPKQRQLGVSVTNIC